MCKANLTGVYQIRNLANGKIYVGSAARCFRRRWAKHRSLLRRNVHHNAKLQRAWNKYGESSFVFEILVDCPKEACIEFEQAVMDRLEAVHRGYNIAPVAGNTSGMPCSESKRAKLSEATRKWHQSGKRPPLSDEARARISHASRTRIRKPVGPEGRARIAASQQNRSAATRAKMAAAHAAMTPEAKASRSAKMSAAKKAYWARKRLQEQENTNGNQALETRSVRNPKCRDVPSASGTDMG